MTTPHTPNTCLHAATSLLLVFNICNSKQYSVSPAPGVPFSFTVLLTHIFVIFHLSLSSVRENGVALGDSSSFILDGGFHSVCVSSGMLFKENSLLIYAFL